MSFLEKFKLLVWLYISVGQSFSRGYKADKISELLPLSYNLSLSDQTTSTVW